MPSGEEGTGSSRHSTVPTPVDALVIGQLEEAESSSKLPPKLLAWGCYPTKLRLNIYSKTHVIGTIASCLQGSQDMETIVVSQFGRLFELHVVRRHNYAKLINSFLCCQLLTVRKYELWFHFATHPLCFSLDEFQQVTGLNCRPFYAANSEAEDDPGSTASFLIQRLVKLRNKWLKLTPKYVEMLCDVEYFLDYPWGRESFLKTLPRLLPPYTSEDPLGEMRHRLSQQTSAAYGFPLALQLFAFEAMPLLLAKIPNAQSTYNFLVDPLACENTVTILSVNDIVEVEEDPDVITDERVTHLVELMVSGHHFQISDFPGGDTSFAPIREDKKNAGKGVRKVDQPNEKPVHRRNLRPRKPAAIIIQDISSSEDKEPEAPPQPFRCTHEDLKPWIEHQLKQLASAFQKQIGELGRYATIMRMPML
ncbi:uncharacterized protein LOC106448046 [Brassica napus]|uniref:uncharacterized protein LOC106448046 n=1 Tax=Brassica napus TaxID=3708 RepID=UPI00207A4AEA|nr:uncharacterized protein LOC106448046 [Brassica napus]